MAFGSPVSSVVIANTDPLNVSVGNIVPVTGPNGGAVSIAGNVGVTGNVSLAPNSAINVVNAVNLAAGAQVNVGNQVTVNGAVDINKVPNDPLYWACKSTDTDPPTLAGSTAYQVIVGQPCLEIRNSSSVNHKAVYGSLPRYGPNGERNMVLTFMWLNTGAASTSNEIFMGYRGALNISCAQAGNDSIRVLVTKVSGSTFVATQAIAMAVKWHKIQVIIGATKTSVSVDDAAKVYVLDGGGTHVKLDDADINAIADANETWQVQSSASAAPGQWYRWSNMTIKYLETEPA